MRWIVVLVVCALTAPAAAAPPSKDAAREVAMAWLQAAARGDGAGLLRVSARPLRVRFDWGLHCPMAVRARTRRQVVGLAHRLKRCLARGARITSEPDAIPLRGGGWMVGAGSNNRHGCYVGYEVSVDAHQRVVHVVMGTICEVEP